MKGLIDIHCHLLPGIDDGPRDMDEAMRMVEIMYGDGIRGAIATSHYNHIIDFKPTETYERSLKALRGEIAKLYPDFRLYAGAEFRVRENYLEIIDSDASKVVLNGTQYILIELQDDVSRKKVLDIVYEIRLRGYIPIIAHVERYEMIYGDEYFLSQVREEGACVQLSARAIAERPKGYRKLKKLLKRGYIDFIASDGHSDIKRKPLLGKAYEEVSKICSFEVADMIFIENPKRLLAGDLLV